MNRRQKDGVLGCGENVGGPVLSTQISPGIFRRWCRHQVTTNLIIIRGVKVGERAKKIFTRCQQTKFVNTRRKWVMFAWSETLCSAPAVINRYGCRPAIYLISMRALRQSACKYEQKSERALKSCYVWRTASLWKIEHELTGSTELNYRWNRKIKGQKLWLILECNLWHIITTIMRHILTFACRIGGRIR